jgi:hypothetical protein
MEVRQRIDALSEPIAVTVGAGRGALQAGGTCATGDKIAIDDPVPFLEGMAQAILLYMPPQAEDLSHHLMTEPTEKARRQARAVSAPHVQVRATDVGATDFHQGVLRPDLGQGIFPNLQLRAGGGKNSDFPVHG